MNSVSISEMYERGKNAIAKKGAEWWLPPHAGSYASVQANRELLDSLFFETRFFDPVEVDTSVSFFNTQLKTPVFISAVSSPEYKSEYSLTDMAKGASDAGAMIILGIGGFDQLQHAVDTGAAVVKMVKPYRKTELIYKKVRDAEQRGCIAVGMDIDHFHGRLAGDIVDKTDLFGPQNTKELRQIFSETKLPVIFKGVLSHHDAKRAADLGASAIMVSNHGNGSVAFSLPSVAALPGIAGKNSFRHVFIDSGLKTGTDAFKTMAMGAHGAGFVTTMFYALEYGGSDGVKSLINTLTAELSRTMAVTGCSSIDDIRNVRLIHKRQFFAD